MHFVSVITPKSSRNSQAGPRATDTHRRQTFQHQFIALTGRLGPSCCKPCWAQLTMLCPNPGNANIPAFRYWPGHAEASPVVSAGTARRVMLAVSTSGVDPPCFCRPGIHIAYGYSVYQERSQSAEIQFSSNDPKFILWTTMQ